jgi:membrane protease YdiL (CAAX protease family)
MALLGVVIAPVVEELVFRGIVLRRWAFKWGVWRGLLASSAVFGLLHGPSAPGLIAFGVVMGLVYIKTSNLWVPIGCHMLNNALALTSQFVPIWNNSDETIAQFQHEWYIGLSCLVVGLAGLVALGRHFLPRQGLRLPEPAT